MPTEVNETYLMDLVTVLETVKNYKKLDESTHSDVKGEWHDLFNLYIFSEEMLSICDDLLFYVETDPNNIDSEKYKPKVNIYRRQKNENLSQKSDNIDWEQSLYLNIIMQC
ncbi:hypothetical protein A3Q56_06836, partial [Intoshia linei]